MSEADACEDAEVRIIDEERANLACYFMRSILRRNAVGKSKAELARFFERGVGVRAGGMTAYVYATADGIVVTPTQREKPGITIEGDLNTLLGILLGGGAIRPFLRGEVRIGGNPLTALKILHRLRMKKDRRE
ncbi:MAG: hypothetical protein ACE5OP_01805 [Candidatus Glassbacteria bacterium]